MLKKELSEKKLKREGHVELEIFFINHRYIFIFFTLGCHRRLCYVCPESTPKVSGPCESNCSPENNCLCDVANGKKCCPVQCGEENKVIHQCVPVVRGTLQFNTKRGKDKKKQLARYQKNDTRVLNECTSKAIARVILR